jgi:ribosomal-protein-alanine N-acetyltransferase
MEESGKSNVRFSIFNLDAADITDVVELEESGGLNSLGRAGFERQLARQGSILLVARDADSTLIGSLSGWVIADEFQIDNVVVKDSCRRRGVGSTLLCRAAQTASLRGAEKAVLEVRAANLAARRLYVKLGFELIGQRPEYYRDPIDSALVMICRGAHWDRLVASPNGLY